MGLRIDGPLPGQSAACMPVLRALPRWFGIEEALAGYERDIDALPTFVARAERDGGDGDIVGFLTVKRHVEHSAEVLVMGVLPGRHRRGVGRALVERCEAWLRGLGVEYLQVKTRGPSRPDEGYARTRAFYAAVGFRPLEEMPDLWDEENPALILVKSLR